jgi:hypothetical protein
MSPETVYRTATRHFTVVEAHPYHQRLAPPTRGLTNPTLPPDDSGVYRRAYDPQCPRCRAERSHNHGH